jgi:hypothetical protein
MTITTVYTKNLTDPRGPSGGLSYLECAAYGDVTCVAQPYAPTLGVLSGTVKCGPSAENFRLFSWVPECWNVKPDLHTILSFDVPGCEALASNIHGRCARIDEGCEAIEEWVAWTSDVARISTYVGGVCARLRFHECNYLAGEITIGFSIAYRQGVCDGIYDSSPKCLAASRDIVVNTVAAATGTRGAYAGIAWQMFVDAFHPGIKTDIDGGPDTTTCQSYSPTPEMGGTGCYS